jgi:hypothetical protein
VNAGFFCVHLILGFRAKSQRSKDAKEEKEMKIELNSQLKNCKSDDVLDLGDSFLCKLGKFKNALIDAITYDFSSRIYQKLKNGGIEVKRPIESQSHGSIRTTWHTVDWTEDVKCKILKINSKGWQDAIFRIKVSVEFELDEPEIEEENTEIQEPESPLDDLRRKINEATS